MPQSARLSRPEPQDRRLLCIGTGALPAPQAGDQVFALSAAEVTFAAMAALAPDLVMLPLLAAGQDAVGLLEALLLAGYRGACLVLAPALPDPRAVEAELAAGAPGLRVRLVVAPDQAEGLSRR